MISLAAALTLPVLLQATYGSVRAELLPLALIAVLLDAAIVGAWYLLGVLLNNSGMKGAARLEFLQVMGTAIIAIIIVGFFGSFGGVLTGAFSTVPSLSSTTVSALCTGIMQSSRLNILSSAGPANAFSFLGGVYQQGQQLLAFPGICSYVAATGTLDQQVNYPLAATAVITANLTNQTAKMLNDVYILNEYTSYLAGVTGLLGLGVRNVKLDATYSPYAGYGAAADAIGTVGTLAAFSMQIYIAELTVVSMLLYIWPYLLFLGLVLRATTFTRKIGGLFIAVALGAVLIYPAVFALEYTANGIGNGLSNVVGGQASVLQLLQQSQLPPSEVYGFNSITDSPLLKIDYTNSSTSQVRPAPTYTANFFVLPNVALISQHYSCWPTVAGSTSLAGAEFLNTLSFMVPAVSQIRFLLPFFGGLTGSSALTGALPHFLVPYSCNAQEVQDIAFALFNVYGLTVVTAILLPIFNIMITLAGIIGLSGLFGGDVSLAGLGRLV